MTIRDLSDRDVEQAGDGLAGSATRWRQLDPGLWAGRLDDRPVGTIEQGRAFVFVDLDGDRHAGYATLEDAKDAATGPIRLPSSPVQRPGALRLSHALAVVVFVLVVLVTVWAVLRY